MTLVARLRAVRIAPDLTAQAALYASPPSDLAAWQLGRLNGAWTESLSRSPWARAMRARLSLPDQFESWAQVGAIQVQTKADLRLDIAVAGGANEPVQWRATGGTTAEPFRFPVFPSEVTGAALDQWTGRARLGVTPADRLFMIWGHAHLFGVGLKGAVNRLRRQWSDRALGYTRWSAYRMAPDDLTKAGDALLASGAAYVVGYSVALDRFARANLTRAHEFRALDLKAVIATAEGFPHADSREVIKACLGCPVVMEYGAVETGAVAYERPGGSFEVFWDRYRVELDDDGAVVVTSLSPRALPLLRYAIGDAAAAARDAALGLSAIRGRVNDAVVLPGGLSIHSEAFTHVLRDLPGVRAYQIVIKAGEPLPILRYEADQALPDASLKRLRERLARVDPRLADAGIEQTGRIPQSVAGKHRMVVREP